MKTDETRSEKFDRQTREQFEGIGRFVQEFERMVDTVRFTCSQLLSKDVYHQRLVHIVLHHQSMTAWPLFEIMQGLYGEIISDGKSIEKGQSDVLRPVLKQIAGEYLDLVSRRNILLHGSWFIGAASPGQQDFSKINLHKLKVSKTGLVAADTPANIEELRELAENCRKNADLILALCLTFVVPGGPRVAQNFTLNRDNRWVKK